MAKPNRVRRVMKWVGLVGCVVLGAVVVMSHFVSMAVTREYPARGFSVTVAAVREGGITIVHDNEPKPVWFGNQGLTRMDIDIQWGWTGVAWWPPRYEGRARYPALFIPFWLPFITVAIPTYILWRRDRRKPEGCCQQCGYDLTGNESGICPECGVGIE